MELPLDAKAVDVEGFNEILLGASYDKLAGAVHARLRTLMDEAEQLTLTFEAIKYATRACGPHRESEPSGAP